MKVSEAFLVNTKNFDAIIETLVKYNAEEPVINSALLEDLCFSDPNDLLVVRILKDFNVIDNDGKPSTNYEEFKNPDTTKLALAKGLASAYEHLFEQYPNIHQASEKKIKEAFESIFKGKKTDLIIKYITGTFQKVVSYVGIPAIDSAFKDKSRAEAEKASAVEVEQLSASKNGTHSNSESNPAVSEVEISDKSFDDIVNDIDSAKTSDDEPDLTVREYTKNDESKDQEDPFGFDDIDDSHEETEPTSKDKNIDVAPVDLDIPLSTATQINNSMENLTAEHQFVQKALLRKSDLLQKMQRWDELLPTLEEIIKRYDNEEHTSLSDAVSRSIIRRATALLKLNKTDKALSALDMVISRLKDSDKKEFFDQASRAMLYKANILERNGSGNLLPLYNTIIDRLDSSSKILMKEKLDEIHIKRFDLITKEGENSEILHACTQLIKRLKDNDEYLKYLQKAMIIRAEMLDEMGKDEEALTAYDEFLSVFGN